MHMARLWDSSRERGVGEYSVIQQGDLFVWFVYRRIKFICILLFIVCLALEVLILFIRTFSYYTVAVVVSL